VKRALWQVALPIAAVAALHYLAPHHAHWVHDIARRLFYVPILVAAVGWGLRGGLSAGLVTVAVYAPHAFLLGHGDPGSTGEKLFEMGFYVFIGVVAGRLYDREARLRAEVARQSEQLARAARLESLGQLTAGLAHEIRNPLHAMRGTAEVLLDAVPEDRPEHEVGRSLVGEIDRLSGVLTRFLNFARKAPTEHDRVALGELMGRVADLVRAQAAQQGTALELDTVEAGDVRGDPEQLVQVVLALALNALQALDQGGTVSLVAGPASLLVRNDGPPLEDPGRVFDPFYTTRPEGTGLGLSVAWRIVELHGGRLEARNEPPGVVFEVGFPEHGAQ